MNTGVASIAGFTRAAIEVPGAVTPVAGADVGVNQALIRNNRGLPVVISPEAIKPGDRVLVYINDRLVHAQQVAVDYDGQPVTASIPSNLIPEGIVTLTYRVNLDYAQPLRVLVKTRLPGGIDPQPNQPGHYLLTPPLLTSTVLTGQQDETVTLAPWQGMSRNDVVTLQFANWTLPHTVQAEEVGQPITLTLSKDMVINSGNGKTLLYYTLRDEVGNLASDHSRGLAITLQVSADGFATPQVEGLDLQNNALYLSQLGSQAVQVSLDTASPPFVAGDRVELVWRSEYSTGQLEFVRQTQVVENTPRLVFNVENAVAQRLAGGCAHLFFNRTGANGVVEQWPFLDMFVVGNTRRVDAPEQEAAGLFSAPDNSVLQIFPPIILGSTQPVVGALCGVSKRIYDDRAPNGADVIIDPVLGAAAFDVVDLILNTSVVDSDFIQPGGENNRLLMTIPNSMLNPNAVNTLVATVTRVGGNTETSRPPLTILYNFIRPGNEDRDSATPGHSELELVLPQTIIDNGVGPIDAALGVPVTFRYPYCRAYDRIVLRLHGLDVDYVVTPAEAPASPSFIPTSITRVITRDQFVQAGDHPDFTFSYTVIDQIGNGPDPRAPRSAEIITDVDLAQARRPAPLFREERSDNNDVSSDIDLEKLAGRPLLLIIQTNSRQFLAGDRIVATYTRLPNFVFTVEGLVTQDAGQVLPLVLEVPNNLVIADSQVRAQYEQFRSGAKIADSRIATGSVRGTAPPVLPPPRVLVTTGDVLDPRDNPQGATGRVEVPGFRPGDQVRLIVQGTPGAGSPTFNPVPLNANGLAEFPLSLAFINANRGGRVNISYQFIRSATPDRNSPVLVLTVLNAFEQPQITSVLAGGINVPAGAGTYYQSGIVISGTGTPDQPVDVFDGATRIGQPTANAQGEWSIPARPFSVGTHVLKVQTIDGSQFSTRAFTVLQGLLEDLVNFNDRSLGGWLWGGAGGANDLSFYLAPSNIYVLHNHTYTNNSQGVVLYKNFNNLQPGATYRYITAAAFTDGKRGNPPILRIRTSTGAATNYATMSSTTFVAIDLFFVANTPEATLYIDNNRATGDGNDWDIPWIQLTKVSP